MSDHIRIPNDVTPVYRSGRHKPFVCSNWTKFHTILLFGNKYAHNIRQTRVSHEIIRKTTTCHRPLSEISIILGIFRDGINFSSKVHRTALFVRKFLNTFQYRTNMGGQSGVCRSLEGASKVCLLTFLVVSHNLKSNTVDNNRRPRWNERWTHQVALFHCTKIVCRHARQ